MAGRHRPPGAHGDHIRRRCYTAITVMLRWSKSYVLPALLLSLGIAGPAACIGKRRPQGGDAAAKKSVGRSPSAEVEPTTPTSTAKVRTAVDAAILESGARFRVDIAPSDPARGAQAPLVTIVEFSDFECPSCAQLAKTLDEVLPRYSDEVRQVFKHYPLANHARAEAAARAAVAAHGQGKFWEMHDLLFANQSALGPAQLQGYAAQLGLDTAAFTTASAATKTAVTVNTAFADGRVLAVSSTPTMFINGRRITGAKSVAELTTLVDAEIALANKLVGSGTPRTDLYARIMKIATPGTGKRPTRDPTHRRGEASKKTHYALSIGEDAPIRGPADAMVTIVEWGAFGCSPCTAMEKNLDKILAKYPTDVRLVWRHFPEDSAVGTAAAKAAIAAQRQGKFWPLHDALLARGADLQLSEIADLARKAGVDPGTYAKDLADDALSQKIATDAAVANKVRGTAPTPTLWVNGRIIDNRDAPSFADIDALVAEELALARTFKSDNEVSPEGLYEAMRATWRGYKLIEAAEGR